MNVLTVVTELHQVQTLLGEMKLGTDFFHTNLYAMPEQMESWVVGRRLQLFRSRDAVILLRNDFRWFRVFHIARNPEALVAALEMLQVAQPSATLVADVVGRGMSLQAQVSLYLKGGFHLHSSLARMARVGSSPVLETFEGVDWAIPKEASEICAFLNARQDPMAEQTPTEAEMRQAAERGEVLSIRVGGLLAGVLVFVVVGQSATLRYWFMDARHQGLGLGSRLIRTFFHECQGCQRLSLWVLSGNQKAIEMYRHYGFNMDGLTDHVLVRD